MKAVLSDQSVAALKPPRKGMYVVWDQHAKAPRGFGCLVTANGAKSFLVAYHVRGGAMAGRERRIVIGKAGAKELTVSRARHIAHDMRVKIQGGYDPLAEREAVIAATKEWKAAPTVADLCERYMREHAEKRKRPRSIIEDRLLIDQHILCSLDKKNGTRHKVVLASLKVAEVTADHIRKLYREITDEFGTPARANGVLALVSKMFSLAVDWKIRPDHPVRGAVKSDERNPSQSRERYLDPKTELPRLLRALDKFQDRGDGGINAIRLLLLTGARRNEVLHAKWEDFDLQTGVWTKLATTTKQKREHRVDLSPQALQLLRQMRADADTGQRRAATLEKQAEREKDVLKRTTIRNKARLASAQHAGPYLFPSARRAGKPLEGVRGLWSQICTEAKLKNLRVHDIRHSYASFLLRQGHSLTLIGHLLGHSRPETTARYSHVMPDIAKAAATDVGRMIAGAGKSRTSAKVIRFPRER